MSSSKTPGTDFLKSIAASQGHDASEIRPGQPTISTSYGAVNAHDADVAAQAVASNLVTLGQQFGTVHAANPLYKVPRIGYAHDDLAHVGEHNGSSGEVKAKIVYGEASGHDPIDSSVAPPVAGDENHKAASNIAPNATQALMEHGMLRDGVVDL